MKRGWPDRSSFLTLYIPVLICRLWFIALGKTVVDASSAVKIDELSLSGGPCSLGIQWPHAPAVRCCLVLDGELYQQRVQMPAIVDALMQTGQIPATTFVYLAAGDGIARHRDLTCNEAYTDLLMREVLESLQRRIGTIEHFFLCGLSLSGLAAIYASVRHPDRVAGCLAQSPSAWWNDEWLMAAIAPEQRLHGRYWLSVGDQEQQADLRHPPTGLHQATSQWDSVHRLASRLKTAHAKVHLHPYAGGHDPACWAKELPTALPWLLGTPATSE